MDDVECLLSPNLFKGILTLEQKEDNLNLNITPKRYLSNECMVDLGNQIGYLMNLNEQLKFPFSFNGETFRYQDS